MSIGIFGGLPGCTIGQTLYRHGNVNAFPESFDEIMGERTETVQWGDYTAAEGDILYVRFQGGGGYGDPIDREPEPTLQDVRLGAVTVGAVYEIYGVVLDEAQQRVDEEATRAQRAAIRRARIGQDVSPELWARQAIPSSSQPLGEYLR